MSVLPGSGARVLLTGSPRGGELLDLETGLAVPVDLPRDLWSILAVDGGVVFVDVGVARFLPLPEGARVDLGPADQVFSAGPEAVWLVRQVSETGRMEADLVDLAGARQGETLHTDEAWIVGSSRDGLITQAGGRIYELDRVGDVTPIAAGEVLGASEGWLVARTCDDAGACGIEVWGPDLESSRRLTDVEGVSARFGGALAVRADGRRGAMITYGPAGPGVVWMDLDTGSHHLLPDVTNVATVTWLPGEYGLLVVKQGQLSRFYEQGDKILVEELRDVGADVAVVIPR